jgi:hypothetical protein
MYHQSTDYDILFECWAVADRLSLHAIAADCEWALAQLWEAKSVYTRAVRHLSPGALQRIARSLSAGTDAVRNELAKLQQNYYLTGAEVRARISKCLSALASAQTMMKWRIRKKERRQKRMRAELGN